MNTMQSQRNSKQEPKPPFDWRPSALVGKNYWNKVWTQAGQFAPQQYKARFAGRVSFWFSSFGLFSYGDGLNEIQKTLYGNYSVSEKYANAFGLNVREFQDKISKKYGVDAHSNRKVCSADSQCDQEKCGIRNGQKTGYCIPTCFGVCHSQAPLKALELAPRLCPTWRYATLLKLHKMSEKIFLTLRDTLAHNKTVASSIGRAPDDTTCFRRDSLL